MNLFVFLTPATFQQSIILFRSIKALKHTHPKVFYVLFYNNIDVKIIKTIVKNK